MTRKRALVAIIAGGAAVLVVGIMVVPDAFDRAFKARFVGPEHVYRLSEHPPYLTEQLAIAKGLETMTRDGFDTNTWTLVPDNRSSAPDGRVDLCFIRNTRNPNQGSFEVRHANGSRRFVQVELKGGTVTSCVVIPK